MQDNISSKFIGNRKISIEVRYAPTMAIIDKRGALIDAFKKADIFDVQSWGFGEDRIILRDTEDDDTAQNIVRISYNRCIFRSRSINSVEGYYAQIEKVVKLLNDIIGAFVIRAVYCRILGTYKSNKRDFSEIVDSFKKAFPSQFLLDGYPAKDMTFRLFHEYGNYMICPLSKDDDVFEKEFKADEKNKHLGFVIDTGNQILLEKDQKFSTQVVKDVYTLSLSIEKDLFNKISSL